MNAQEPPLQPPSAIAEQPKEQAAQDIISMVDSLVIVTTIIEEPTKEQIGQDVTTTKSQGAPP